MKIMAYFMSNMHVAMPSFHFLKPSLRSQDPDPLSSASKQPVYSPVYLPLKPYTTLNPTAASCLCYTPFKLYQSHI